MKKFSIVIPCYNEAENIRILAKEINASITRDDIEVILVNNGSTDESAKILEETTNGSSILRVVTVVTNKGYGHGILAGLRTANGDYVGWMHGDLQTSFRDAMKALAEIESLSDPRNIYIKGLRKGRSILDNIFTLGMSVYASILLRKKLFDINAQPNIFHRTFFELWIDPPSDFSLDLYALFMARIYSLDIIRIPVQFPPRRYGKSHWNIGLSSRMKFIRRTLTYIHELKRKKRATI